LAKVVSCVSGEYIVWYKFITGRAAVDLIELMRVKNFVKEKRRTGKKNGE